MESSAGSVFTSTGAKTIAEEVIADIELAWREILYMCLIALGEFSPVCDFFLFKAILFLQSKMLEKTLNVVSLLYQSRIISCDNDHVSIPCCRYRLCYSDHCYRCLRRWNYLCLVNGN